MIFYVVFAIVALGGFYLALFAGTDQWKTKLPVLNDVKPFRFADQLGDTITERNTAGKVYVAEYFFTTCKGICPRMNENMKREVYEVYKNEPRFIILSHSVDPEKDSVARMKHYGDSLGIDPKHWLLLTGTKTALYDAARQSYLLDDQNNNKAKISEQFIHTQLFALVDKSGRVRGIYDGLSQTELEKLRKDIADLLKEAPEQPHFVNGIFNNNPS